MIVDFLLADFDGKITTCQEEHTVKIFSTAKVNNTTVQFHRYFLLFSSVCTVKSSTRVLPLSHPLFLSQVLSSSSLIRAARVLLLVLLLEFGQMW